MPVSHREAAMLQWVLGCVEERVSVTWHFAARLAGTVIAY